MRDGIIDLIVGEVRDYEISDLAQKPLFEDRLIVDGGSRHPPTAQESVRLDALKAYQGDRRAAEFGVAQRMRRTVPQPCAAAPADRMRLGHDYRQVPHEQRFPRAPGPGSGCVAYP
ncbi:type 2 periplasmic-binding domain-containing protein [Paraburkholderia xenovorans]|uniref:Uncharacterized protein n=1 Tax=Paraburkholderia xenovorans (strain LB400) TaxID=266265 RepID=Q143M5_PARXL|nr:hypothetical protein Bxe_A3523 [Paraburkholderia xenovorans LB400]